MRSYVEGAPGLPGPVFPGHTIAFRRSLRPMNRGLSAATVLRLVTLLALSGRIVAVPSATPASPPTPTPTAQPTPSLTPKPGTFGDLPAIVLDEDDLQPGETIDSLDVGFGALVQPVTLLETSTFSEQPGFVDARMTRIGTQGQDSYWEVGGYVSWAALYESDAAAERAFEVLVAEHESEAGWAMERVGRPPYGDEAVTLDGAAYGWDTNRLHIWRDRNLLLAVGALGVTATSDEAIERGEAIAQSMDARAAGR